MMKIEKEPMTWSDAWIFLVMVLVIGGIFYLNNEMSDYSVSVAIFRKVDNVMVTGTGQVADVPPIQVEKVGGRQIQPIVINISPKSEQAEYIALFHRIASGTEMAQVKVGDAIAFRGKFRHGGATGTHKIFQTSYEETGKKPDLDGWIKIGGKQYPPSRVPDGS